MAQKADSIIERLDRSFSVLALSLMLLLQGVVAGGAAAGYASPWLVAPDGTLLSYADICNNSGEGAADHCAECVPLDNAAMQAGVAEPSHDRPLEARVPAVPHDRLASRPEAHHSLRTGPPVT